jgi:hypothetical protein
VDQELLLKGAGAAIEVTEVVDARPLGVYTGAQRLDDGFMQT